MLSAEPRDFAPRLKTWAFHLDRSSARFTVPDQFAADKSAKLDELQKLLAAGAQNDEQFTNSSTADAGGATTFSDGTTVTVDFDAKTHEIVPGLPR